MSMTPKPARTVKPRLMWITCPLKTRNLVCWGEDFKNRYAKTFPVLVFDATLAAHEARVEAVAKAIGSHDKLTEYQLANYDKMARFALSALGPRKGKG
jgi:hypothetical protein